METRVGNKAAHPGNIIKPTARRTKAEIEQERVRKAQATAARTEAKQQRINRTAAFEHADMANEDIVDATPRLPFAPKRPASTCNSTPTDLAMSGVEDSEFNSSDKGVAVATENSSVESSSDESSPPAQRNTRLTVAKATRTTVQPTRKVQGKAQVMQSDTETELDDDETPKKVKPKPKPKVRDEIDVATKKLVEKNERELEAARPTRQAEVGLSGRPASKAPSQLEVVRPTRLPAEARLSGRPASNAPSQLRAGGEEKTRGKNLKREGAIADINQSTKRSHEPADNNRYAIFALTFMFPFLTLDRCTLFYWMLTSEAMHKKQKHSAVNEWASQIDNAKPAFRAPTSRSVSSRAKSSISSLTGGTACLSTSASSVLSKNVKITSHQSLDSAKADPPPDLASHVNGGLSDNDETKGEERMAAINSPLKGKKRVNSEVCRSH